jgi:membrane-associated protease RseP (regulator of RpoE activity)
MTLPDHEVLKPIIARLFHIDDIILGDPQRDYIIRYRGHLLAEDSEAAYVELAESLRPYEITPLFRVDESDGRHLIFLKSGVVEKRPSKIWVNIVLFVLTVFSVIWAGVPFGDPEKVLAAVDPVEQIKIAILTGGLPFAITLLAILLAHEFGHYFAARYHKTDATLPYFVPLPIIGILGTMGAVIVWKEPPRNRRVLFDVGIAGPLAGLIVTIPLLYLGLKWSALGPVTASGGFIEGNSLIYLAMKYAVFGRLLPAPETYGGLPSILYWIQYFLTGQPLPIGGVDVMIGPVAFAAWAGLLVTAMNLLPVGQLDGGHVAYVLLGKKARYLLPAILIFIGLLSLFWSGWWLFLFVILLVGRNHPEPLDQITEMDTGRLALALVMIVIFLLVFIPIPFSLLPTG